MGTNEFVDKGSGAYKGGMAAGVAWDLALGGAAVPGEGAEAAAEGVGAADEGAEAGADAASELEAQPNRIYSGRVLARMAEDTGPNHNFPAQIDDMVFKYGNQVVKSDTYTQYELEGYINGNPGIYQIGVERSPSGGTEIITHHFFKPFKP